MFGVLLGRRRGSGEGVWDSDIYNYRKCKYNLYMRYEGSPMNGLVCSRWKVPKRRKC